MERIASGIQAHPDVQNVQFNTQTGSILVHHDPHRSNSHEMKGVMRDLGCIFGDITGTEDLLAAGTSDNSLDFGNAISDLNKRVLEITNGVVDLRLVIPLGLGALAVFQLLTYGLQFELVPWFVLAYFAVDSFFKLDLNQDPEESATQSS
jgi:hypothetical protein